MLFLCSSVCVLSLCASLPEINKYDMIVTGLIVALSMIRPDESCQRDRIVWRVP